MDKPVSILVVDDDQRLCDLLARYLGKEGFQVITALNGEEMRRNIDQKIPDLIILDLMLPGEDGLLLAKELRMHQDQGLGIIILTGKSETVDKIVGLEIGADDYIAKPFDNRELLARIHSVLRRLKPNHNYPQSLSENKTLARFAGWSLDLVAYELISPAGETVHLTSYEFKFLSTLVQNNNRLISREKIFELIAGRKWRPYDRSLDVLVAKLRKKLQSNPADPVLIKTIRGEGYKLTVPVVFE
jgi:DNA-binding response OmpR family regulator